MRASNAHATSAAIAALALTAACASPSRVSSPAPPQPTAAPAPEPTPFHVVAASVLRGRKTIDHTTLCPISGAVFVCGVRRMIRLVGDDLVHDPALEAGLPHDEDGRLAVAPYEMIGRWPDEAWLVTGQFARTLHRWSNDRWKRIREWPSVGNLEAVEIARWSPGRVLVFSSTLFEKAAFETYGDGPAPPLPQLTLVDVRPSPCWHWWFRRPLVIAPDGTITLYRAGCGGTDVDIVETWAPGAVTSTVVRERPPAIRPQTGTYHFDGGRFVKRREDGALVPVAMPELPATAPPGAQPLSPERVWEIAPGDVWVRASFRIPNDIDLATRGAVLLRTIRPTRQLDLTR